MSSRRQERPTHSESIDRAYGSFAQVAGHVQSLKLKLMALDQRAQLLELSGQVFDWLLQRCDEDNVCALVDALCQEWDRLVPELEKKIGKMQRKAKRLEEQLEKKKRQLAAQGTGSHQKGHQ